MEADMTLVEQLRGAYSTVFERSLAKRAADRIEALEKALDEARCQRLLYAAEHWCMEECRICDLNDQIDALLTSAAPEQP
jgi:hypothetical protein